MSPATAEPPSAAGASGPGPLTALPGSRRDRLRACRGAVRHPDLLVTLEVLALRLQRRRDHQLRAVELRDVLVAARGHRRAQATHQVEGAVVLVRGPGDDLLERAVL